MTSLEMSTIDSKKDDEVIQVTDKLREMADKNGDGIVDESEMEDFLTRAAMDEALRDVFCKVIVLMAICCVILVVLLATMTGFTIQFMKESYVKDQVFVDGSGKDIQCASKEFMIADDGLMTDKMNQAGIRTLKVPAISHPLNSKVPDKYLQRLVEFTAKVGGQTQYVKVNSFQRIIDVTMECGSYVLLSTNIGDFKLDTTHLWHNGGTVEVIGSFKNIKGRKLAAAEIIAFYEDVADIEFECNLVWQDQEDTIKKPSLPALPMSFISVEHHPCTSTSYDGTHDVCDSTFGPNARQSKPGVSADRKSLIRVKQTLVTEDEKITVSYYPNHPLQKVVEIFRKDNNTATKYQLYLKNPTKFRCTKTVVNNGTADIDYSSLHYLGTGTHEKVPIRKWAAAILNDEMRKASPKEFNDFMGITEHSYLEFWDTDDDNNYPYFAGIMDTEEESNLYAKSFFKSVQAGLDGEQVQTWLNQQLQGSYANGTCRKSRKLFKRVNDDSLITIPLIDGSLSRELKSDVNFYLEQLSVSSAMIPEVPYQVASFAGYWALAAHGYTPPIKNLQKKETPASLLLSEHEENLNLPFLDMMYKYCEELGSEKDYQLCRESVKSIAKRRDEAYNKFAGQTHKFASEKDLANMRNSSSRRLSGYPSYEVGVCSPAVNDGIFGYRTNRDGSWEYSFWEIKPIKVEECIRHCHKITDTDDVTFKVNMDADGMAFEFTRKESWEIEKITHTNTAIYGKQIQCALYKKTLKSQPVRAGDKVLQVPGYVDTTLEKYLWGYTYEVFKQERREGEVNEKRSTTFGLSATGASQNLGRVGFQQTLTGGGELKMTRETGKKTELSGKMYLVYTAGRTFCSGGGVGGGKFEASVSVQGSAEVSSQNGWTFELSGSIAGAAGAYMQRVPWKSCNCPFEDNCRNVAGGKVAGTIYVKVLNIKACRQPTMDVGIKVEISVSFGGLIEFGLSKDWPFLNGAKVGQPLSC